MNNGYPIVCEFQKSNFGLKKDSFFLLRLLCLLKHSSFFESVLIHIQNDIYYPNLLEKLTHLVYSVIQNHAFVDGNKRTALACGAYFLGLNGYDKKIDNYLDIMEDVVVNVASNQTTKQELNLILEEIIYDRLVKKLPLIL